VMGCRTPKLRGARRESYHADWPVPCAIPVPAARACGQAMQLRRERVVAG
jgi:hypothetical protein